MTPNERAAPGQERDPRLDERLDQRLSQQNTQPPFAAQDVRRSAWAGRIATAWRGAVGCLGDGQALAEAKAAMPHGAFTAMIENDLPFKPSTAQRLMKIAADERLAEPCTCAAFAASLGHALRIEQAQQRAVRRQTEERRD